MSHAALADAPSPPAIGPQALRYKVKGMDCPTCAGKIETAVSRLPGCHGRTRELQQSGPRPSA